MHVAERTIDVIREILEIHAPAEIELSSYVDTPRRRDNPRKYHGISTLNALDAINEILKLGEKTFQNPTLWDQQLWEVALSSRVKMRDGRLLHIPMIDFRARVEENGLCVCKEKLLSVIAEAASGRILPGYLLCSGQSFHYIGLNLLTEDEFVEFAGFCLLCEDGKDPARFSPVDRRWLGHSLIRKRFILRIFANQKRPEPYVVERIDRPA